VTRARRAAVLGSPVGHSLSPVLHRAAYAALGLTGWEYEARECDEAGLPGLFATLDATWCGLSLTMPLKRAVLPLLDVVSPLAVAVGGANTVTWEPGAGGRRRAAGSNTDVHGIVAALGEAGVTSVAGRPGAAVVLGGGATACSAIAALRELGCDRPVVQVRSQARAGELLAAADRLGVRPVLGPLTDVGVPLGADVVVGTLPAAGGAAWAGRFADAAGPSGEKPAGLLLDVVYHPWPTAAATAWEAAGGAAVGGFAMLLHQAAAQVELMTGATPPVAAMRTAGEAELARRAAATTVP
jgi:shikimate dehydrogenase